MTKHVDRIWRTVVFAGAMLGAPVVAADTKPPVKPGAPVKPPAPDKKPDTVESVTKELAAVDTKITVATEAVTNAQSDADRQAAKAKLDQYKKTKAELEKKLAELKAGKAAPTGTPVSKLEKELAAVDAKLKVAVDAVAAAQSDADRKVAQAKLEGIRKQKVEIENKLAEEKQKAGRPRRNDSDRPIGRGFVLA